MFSKQRRYEYAIMYYNKLNRLEQGDFHLDIIENMQA